MASPAQNNVSRNYWLCTQTRGDCIEFEWTFEKFHQLLQKNGEDIYSHAFPNNSNEQWELQIYPDGCEEEDAGWISVFLWPSSDEMLGIEVKYEITVSRLNKVLTIAEIEHKFQEMRGFRCGNLIERSKLSVQDDPMDTIAIRCRIHTLGTHITSSEKLISNTVSFKARKNRLTEDFQSFYKNRTSTDFTVISGDKKFSTHKIILASRSPVFAAMFQHKGVQENITNELKIENMEPAIVGGLLEFIYTDAVSEIEKLGHGLLAAAEQYGLEGLKNLCEETLYKTLNEDNAAKLLALADLHNASQLKKYVMQFIVAHPQNVFQSESFKSMKLSDELYKEILCAVTFTPSENCLN